MVATARDEWCRRPGTGSGEPYTPPPDSQQLWGHFSGVMGFDLLAVSHGYSSEIRFGSAAAPPTSPH